MNQSHGVCKISPGYAMCPSYTWFSILYRNLLLRDLGVHILKYRGLAVHILIYRCLGAHSLWYRDLAVHILIYRGLAVHILIYRCLGAHSLLYRGLAVHSLLYSVLGVHSLLYGSLCVHSVWMFAQSELAIDVLSGTEEGMLRWPPPPLAVILSGVTDKAAENF